MRENEQLCGACPDPRIAELEKQLTESRKEQDCLYGVAHHMKVLAANALGKSVALYHSPVEPVEDLVAQFAEARDENDRLRKPVTIRCSYCNEIICTEAEWDDKVPDHIISCPKNPARIFALDNARLLAENERLKAALNPPEAAQG